MSGDSSQKFIARNRAPRVQIEYDVELYGSQKSVQLPFVMGVLSDLSGKSQVDQPAVADRKFLEIDVDNFDERMKAMAPRVAFSVPNTLTGEGNLNVDLTFESMRDFTPGAIASKVEALRPLLEARQQLSNLMAYMDGKSGAEALIESILADPALLAAVSDVATGTGDTAAALDSLRALTPEDAPVEDAVSGVLDALRAQAPDNPPVADTASAALHALRAQAPPDITPPDDTGAALDSLAALDLPEDAADNTDDLLADLAGSAPPDITPPDDTGAALDSLADDPDDLLGDLDAKSDDLAGDDASLDDLLGECETQGDGDDLDDLLGDLDMVLVDDIAPQTPAATLPQTATLADRAEITFGTLGAERPDAQRLNRRRFRLAILGDFSGRAARGKVETGDALAARRAILLDPDTVEDVIAGFATDLVLPIGRDGAGIAIRLRGLDDLHPDELYENVELFAELVGLRQQLASGGTAANAADRLTDWGAAFGTPVTPPKTRSAGNAVPADRRLSDFQKLIGDTGNRLAQASPIDELLARIVGPHVRALPDAKTQAMQAAVDQALSAAMRLVLHHPEFQSIEAQWRAIDLIARSIETDDTLEVMLYDISAEEIAADLADADDLAQSGLARLLTGEPLDPETGRGGYSALIGLYSFEETPPHADLLGRIARVAAHVDAPFIAAISPAFLDVDKKDRHPLVASSWDELRAMPEAGHLALASPRFLLRRPYGAKSEPIYAFEFEEFTMSEGLGGMLWANPAVLVAILLAQSFRKNGESMNLGSVMSLGGMPYHYVTDRHGDQVALPCTERNLTQSKVEIAMARGIMPVVSIKGRDEIRLASFQSLAGGDILGVWNGVAPPAPSAPKPVAAPAATPATAQDAAAPADAQDSSDLDDLLAGFDDDAEIGIGAGDDDIDADLAALLDDL